LILGQFFASPDQTTPAIGQKLQSNRTLPSFLKRRCELPHPHGGVCGMHSLSTSDYITYSKIHIRPVLIESDHFKAQVRQVLSTLKLDKSRFRPFTICLKCNRRLEERTKEAINDRVPPYVFLTQEHFAECPACRRLYRQGTHWQAMNREMDAS
jgi:hypothetical protein